MGVHYGRDFGGWGASDANEQTKSEKPESENQSEAPEEKGTDALADDAPLDVRVNASQQK